jgi:hypothetical protein
MLSMDVFFPGLGGNFFVSIMSLSVCGVPLLLNSIYLFRLLTQKKIQA